MGILDDPLREVASIATGLFTTTKVTIEHRTSDHYNLTTGVREDWDDATQEVLASPPVPFTAREIAGTSIQAGDLQTIVAAKDLTFIPDVALNPVLTRGSVEYRVVGIETLPSGDQDAAYILQLRR
jgi:hypothetical protein